MARFVRRIVTATALGCLLLPSTTRAQAPAAAPPQTFWNWMGVPKSPLARVVNRGGNFPSCEKKPPLKAIADPQNLASSNPAIKKAAEIKAAEDLAPQKIKAIKYLAEIGCGGCYPGVGEALSAALDDCTEAVRYEAVKAILAASDCGQNDCVKKCVAKTKTCREATCDRWVSCMKRTCATMHLLCGKPGPDGATLKSRCPGYGCGVGGGCQPGRCACGDGNCCTSDILNKLSTMAFEKDDKGCWKEPSPRVRAMARQALRACGPHVRPYTEAPEPEPEVIPAEPGTDKEIAPEQERETAPADDTQAAESETNSVLRQDVEDVIATGMPEPAATAQAEQGDRGVDASLAECPEPTEEAEDRLGPVAPSPEDLTAAPQAAVAPADSAPRALRPAAAGTTRPRMTRRGGVMPVVALRPIALANTR